MKQFLLIVWLNVASFRVDTVCQTNISQLMILVGMFSTIDPMMIFADQLWTFIIINETIII